MHGKGEETPRSLTGRNISSIEIELNFVLAGSKLHGGAIMAFIDILVDVLNGLNGSDTFHINVAAIFP